MLRYTASPTYLRCVAAARVEYVLCPVADSYVPRAHAQQSLHGAPLKTAFKINAN
jgi:hypothetical protein